MSAECGICCEQLRSSSTSSTTPCGHVFHQQCLTQWLVRSFTCPQCRSPVSVQMTRPIYLNFGADDSANVRSLENTIVALQHMLETKDAKIATHKSINQKMIELTTKLEVVEAFERQSTAKCAALETSNRKLRAELGKRVNEMEHYMQQDKLIEQLTAQCSALEKSKRKLESELKKQVKEVTTLQKSRALKEKPLSSTEHVSEERGKKIATVQEGRAIKKETVPSAELQSKQRKKNIAAVQKVREVKEETAHSAETQSEQRKKNIATVQKAKKAKENLGPCNNVATKAKRTPRQALSTIASNTDTQATPQNQRYFLRPR